MTLHLTENNTMGISIFLFFALFQSHGATAGALLQKDEVREIMLQFEGEQRILLDSTGFTRKKNAVLVLQKPGPRDTLIHLSISSAATSWDLTLRIMQTSYDTTAVYDLAGSFERPDYLEIFTVYRVVIRDIQKCSMKFEDY